MTWGPSQKVDSNSESLMGTQETACLTSSQVLLVLPDNGSPSLLQGLNHLQVLAYP